MPSRSEAEREKYAQAWAIPAYAQDSPGLAMVDLFLRIARPDYGESIVDVGAGAGAASRALKDKGFSVTGFDLTDEAWDHADIKLLTGCIWHGLPSGMFRHAYCCDVMEHIPTEFVALAISNILGRCGKGFFSVCFREDHFGRFLREPLHLTVKPFAWWRDLFRELGTVYEARDLLGDGVFYVGR